MIKKVNKYFSNCESLKDFNIANKTNEEIESELVKILDSMLSKVFTSYINTRTDDINEYIDRILNNEEKKIDSLLVASMINVTKQCEEESEINKQLHLLLQVLANKG